MVVVERPLGLTALHDLQQLLHDFVDRQARRVQGKFTCKARRFLHDFVLGNLMPYRQYEGPSLDLQTEQTIKLPLRPFLLEEGLRENGDTKP